MTVADKFIFDPCGKRIFVAGHQGMVGSAMVRQLKKEGATVLDVGRDTLDLRDQVAVNNWLKAERPDAVVVAAAKVGGIHANAAYPAEFLYDNLMIEANLINGAHLADVQRLLFLGSSCIYPKLAEQPIHEDALLTGPLEPTNEWYAIAKIAGIKLCDGYRKQYKRSYISAMPTNLYGPDDNFHPENSHVIPSLMRRFHEAMEHGDAAVSIWGSGRPRREFLHVDDVADALVLLLKVYDKPGPINVGSGEDLPVIELARMIADVVGFEGRIDTDLSRPDGTPRKLMDSRRISGLGWKPQIGLREGLSDTYAWFRTHAASDS